MPRLIQLTKGYQAIVDDEDFELVSRFKWHVKPDRNTMYAVRSKTYSHIQLGMHQLILPNKPGFIPHHIDENGLNNRRANLEYATQSINIMKANKISGDIPYIGVYMSRGKFIARIRVNTARLFLGSFSSAIEAARAYNKAVIKYYGPDFPMNEIDNV